MSDFSPPNELAKEWVLYDGEWEGELVSGACRIDAAPGPTVALPGSETLDFPDNSPTTRSFSPLLENHKHRGHDQHEPHQVVPLDGSVQVQDRKDREHCQRNHFLNRLQLHGAEFVRPNTIGRDLKAIFKNAMPQLIRMTLKSGACRYFRCPYQAKVMKILEMVSRTIVVILVMLP